MFEVENILISKKLLIALGVETQSDTNICIDQETKSPIAFDGKFVKANTDPEKAMYIDADHDVKLDPLDPKCTKMIERFFGKFLTDGEEMENLPHCLSYYFDLNKEDKKTRLTIKFEDENFPTWVGNWYYNKVLCYVEAIFSLDGTFIDEDLRPYDIQYDLLEE